MEPDRFRANGPEKHEARKRNSAFETAVIQTKLLQMKSKFLLPAIFIAVLAISRIPGLMPGNFSVVYAFAFCSGVYFQGAAKWWLPLGTMMVTDVALNLYYHVAPFDPH